MGGRAGASEGTVISESEHLKGRVIPFCKQFKHVHVPILIQFKLVSRSCSIISFVIMYAGLPPELAENANGKAE